MIAVTLAGSALKAEATRLAIPGRSRMSADELRAAIAAALTALDTPDAVTADLDDWAAEAASRALSDRHGTSVPDQRPLPATADLGPDDWRREVRQILADPPMPAITPTQFAARWGKRKPSLNGRIRRSH